MPARLGGEKRTIEMNETGTSINVLWVVDHLGFDERIHGAGMFYLNVIPAFDDRAFNVGLCVLRKRDSLHRYVVERGIEPVHYLGRSKYDPLTIFDLRRVLLRGQTDIMHLHGYGANNFGRLARTFLRIPTIVHQHDPATYYPFYQKVADRIFLRFTDATLAVSESIRHATAVKRGTPLDQIRVVPTCTPLDRFEPPDREEKEAWREELGIGRNRKVIGTITRLYEQKGNEYLIRAMPRVIREFPDAVLFVVGDGPLRSELEHLARELEVGGHVVFTGHCQDVRRMLGAFDVKVLPSLWEGTPITMLEAMAMAKPIVATTIDGIGEVLTHDATALLVPPRDPDELAEKMLLLLRDGETARRLGEAARELSREYDVKACAGKLEDLYRRLYEWKLSGNAGRFPGWTAESPAPPARSVKDG